MSQDHIKNLDLATKNHKKVNLKKKKNKASWLPPSSKKNENRGKKLTQ